MARPQTDPRSGLDAQLVIAAEALPEHVGFCVAFSGGRDSTALLSALQGHAPERVRAVHVHHGLHPAADAWARHCRQFCEQAGIPLQVLEVAVRATGEGPEAAAREARYAALAQQLAAGELLVTAHHADDQAETVLMRLLRGAGPAGAGAMAPLQPFADGWLWRPLLTVPRAELERYCSARGLPWIDDPQNTDGSNLRSRLRPLLQEIIGEVPGAVEALVRFAGTMRGQQTVIDRLADARLAPFLDDGRLAIAAFEGEPAAVRAALWRRWCARLGLPRPGQAWIEQAEGTVVAAAADAQPRLAHGPCVLTRHRGQLVFLEPMPAVPDGWSTVWDGVAPLVLPGGAGRLVCDRGAPASLQVELLPQGEGLRLRPEGAPHRRRMKQWFQELGIPPWERSRTPLLRVDSTPVQVGNLRLNDAGALLGACRIRWQAPVWHRPLQNDGCGALDF